MVEYVPTELNGARVSLCYKYMLNDFLQLKLHQKLNKLATISDTHLVHTKG